MVSRIQHTSCSLLCQHDSIWLYYYVTFSPGRHTHTAARGLCQFNVKIGRIQASTSVIIFLGRPLLLCHIVSQTKSLSMSMKLFFNKIHIRENYTHIQLLLIPKVGLPRVKTEADEDADADSGTLSLTHFCLTGQSSKSFCCTSQELQSRCCLTDITSCTFSPG